MEDAGVPEFDRVLEQLSKDLAELESVSHHLASIKEYAELLKGFDKRFQNSLEQIDIQVQAAQAVFNKAIVESKNGLGKNITSLQLEADRLSILYEKFQTNGEAISLGIKKLEDFFAELSSFTTKSKSSVQAFATSIEEFQKQRNELSANLNSFFENNQQLDATVKKFTTNTQHASQSINASAEKIDIQVTNTQKLLNDFLKIDRQISNSVESIQKTLTNISEINFAVQFGKMGQALNIIWQEQKKYLQMLVQIANHIKQYSPILEKLVTSNAQILDLLMQSRKQLIETKESIVNIMQENTAQTDAKMIQAVISLKKELGNTWQAQIAALEKNNDQQLQRLYSKVSQTLERENSDLKKRIFLSQVILFAAIVFVLIMAIKLIK
jgi:hypothetical protein